MAENTAFIAVLAASAFHGFLPGLGGLDSFRQVEDAAIRL
jgi:hypothetical protein